MEKNFYCLKCKQYKDDYDECVRKKHPFVRFDKLYQYDCELIDKQLEGEKVSQAKRRIQEMRIARRIWRWRFINPPSEEIIPYDYTQWTENLGCNCPIHNKRPYGFCIDCDRLVCFDENTHFSHRYILFSDHGLHNELAQAHLKQDETTPPPVKKLLDERREFVEANNDIGKAYEVVAKNDSSENLSRYDADVVDVSTVNHNMETIRCIDSFISNQEMIFERSREIRDKALSTLADTLSKIYRERKHSVIRRHLLYAMLALDSLDERTITYEVERAMFEKKRIITKIKKLCLSKEIQTLLHSFVQDRQYLASRYKPAIAKYRMQCIMFGTALFVDDDGLYFYKHPNENLSIETYYADHFIIINFQQRTKELFLQNMQLRRGEANELPVVRRKKLTHKYKDFLHINRNIGSDRCLYFISDDNKLIKVELETLNEEECSIDLDLERCKRMLTTFEDNECYGIMDREERRTANTQILQLDDNSLHYYRYGEEVKRVDYDLSMDPNIEMYVANVGLRDDVNRGTFVSRNYVHKASLPELPISCNSVWFDERIILILNRSAKLFEYKY